jgi:hypothetical protein
VKLEWVPVVGRRIKKFWQIVVGDGRVGVKLKQIVMWRWSGRQEETGGEKRRAELLVGEREKRSDVKGESRCGYRKLEMAGTVRID